MIIRHFISNPYKFDIKEDFDNINITNKINTLEKLSSLFNRIKKRLL